MIGVLPDPDLDLGAWDLNQDELIWVRQDHQTRLMMGDSCVVTLNPDSASYFDAHAGHNLAGINELV